MNFVELGPPDPFVYVVLFVSVALFSAGMVIVFRGERTWSLISAIVLALVGFFGFIMGFLWFSAFPASTQSATVGDQIAEAYGLELSAEELGSLSYPAERPEADFKVFGSFSIDEPEENGFLRTEVFLIWRDGEMALAGSPDGETFTELQR